MSDDQTQALIDHVARLEHRIGVMEDVQAIRNMVHAYGYYSDKLMHEETIDCFAENATIRFRNGLFKGKAGVRRFWSDYLGGIFGGHDGPPYGQLLDHCLTQDIIHVADDRQSAKIRYRYFSQGGVHESRQKEGNLKAFWNAYFEGGVAEDTLVKENGVWKFLHWHYETQWQADYFDSWHKNTRIPNKFTTTFPENPRGPDELVHFGDIWPHVHVFPFHYAHPVTGEAPEVPGQ